MSRSPRIERSRNAVFFVQGFLTVADNVIVFDVVVNERGFVETLNGGGDFLQPSGIAASA